jgi:hypothetical protein
MNIVVALAVLTIVPIIGDCSVRPYVETPGVGHTELRDTFRKDGFKDITQRIPNYSDSQYWPLPWEYEDGRNYLVFGLPDWHGEWLVIAAIELPLNRLQFEYYSALLRHRYRLRNSSPDGRGDGEKRVLTSEELSRLSENRSIGGVVQSFGPPAGARLTGDERLEVRYRVKSAVDATDSVLWSVYFDR